MRRFDIKKKSILKRVLSSQFFRSFRKALGIGSEFGSTSDSQVSMKGLSDIFPPYDEHQRVNAQLLEMEMHKAEAIQAMREHARYA